MLTLLDVPALDASGLEQAERRLLGAGRPRSGAARRPELLRPDGRDPDRDVPLRAGAAERRRRALRPARSRHRGLLAAAAGRGAAARRPAGERVRRRGGRDEQGVPVAEVAAADRRGVRGLSREALRGDPLPAHRSGRGLPGGRRPRPAAYAFELDPEIVRFPDQYRYQFDPYDDGYLADVYSSLDVLLNPAMGEGFGLPVLEAQACGVPAIVTDFTAMSEVCGAGWKCGYDRVWTPMRAWQAWPNVEEVVESLEECYALSERDRLELRDRARAHALAVRRRPRAGGALAAGARGDRAAGWTTGCPSGSRRWSREARMIKPLVVIPNYMSEESDMEILGQCVQSIRQTVSNSVDILIVDDCSPQPWLVDVFESRYDRYDFELIRKPENEGFSRTVNVGLARARDEGREAILMNADIVMRTPGWLGKCRKTTARAGSEGRPRRCAAALPERPDPACGPLLLADRQHVRAPVPLRPGQPARGAREDRLPGHRRLPLHPARGARAGGALRPDVPAWAARTSTTGSASSRPASTASTSRRSTPSTTSRCSGRGPNEKLDALAGDELRLPAPEVGGRADRPARARALDGHRRGRPLPRPVGGRELLPPHDAPARRRSGATGAGSTRRRRGWSSAAARSGSIRASPTSARTGSSSCRRRRRRAGSTSSRSCRPAGRRSCSTPTTTCTRSRPTRTF